MTLLTAHSGCDQTEDNSMEFLKYAFQTEADCIEVDVRKDKKDQLILSHEEAEGEAVALQEVFRLAKFYPEKKINCDLKHEGLELNVFSLAKEFGVEEQLIYSGTNSLEVLQKEKINLFPVKVYYNIELVFLKIYNKLLSHGHTEPFVQELCEATLYVKKFGIRYININHNACSKGYVDFLKAQGMNCSVWTVNEIKDMERFLKWEVENITTRNVKNALQIAKSKEVRG